MHLTIRKYRNVGGDRKQIAEIEVFGHRHFEKQKAA